MNRKEINLNRVNKILAFIFLVALLLYLGRLFLIPVAIAAFFAMLLYPIVIKLQAYKLKKSLAALFSILLLLAALALISSVVYYQLSALEANLPELEEKIDEKTSRLQWLLYKTTDIPTYEQEAILEQKKPDIIKSITKGIKNLLIEGLYILLITFVVLTYTFFFLIYRHRIQYFCIKLGIFKHPEESRVISHRIAAVVHDYLKGTFTVIAILAVVYALGFWAIGIEHAILFALITALMRIVPYFGSFLGIAFPIAFAFLTKESAWYPIGILLFFMAAQLLEANLLTPFITGSRVKLNPLITIMAILLGNLLWGVAGMILFVPLFGILKVIFDEIPALNVYGYILGKDEAEDS